jgi:excisionase family DNA binding protein
MHPVTEADLAHRAVGSAGIGSTEGEEALAAPRSIGNGDGRLTTEGAGIKLLLAQEVAEILKIPVVSVYKLARQKLLPSVRPGRLVGFEEDALCTWIASGGSASIDREEPPTPLCRALLESLHARGEGCGEVSSSWRWKRSRSWAVVIDHGFDPRTGRRPAAVDDAQDAPDRRY